MFRTQPPARAWHRALRGTGIAAACSLLAGLSLPGASRADTVRKVPDGTLNYTITLTGHAEQKGRGIYHDQASEHRHLQLKIRLRGAATTADPSSAPEQPTTDALAKAADRCAGDETCMMQLAMQMSPQQRQAMAQEGRQVVARLGQDSAWYSERSLPCQVTASVDGEERLVDMDAGEGYSTVIKRHGTRRGQQTIDCTDKAEVKLLANAGTHTGTLTIPPFTMQATVSDDSGQPAHRQAVRFEGVTLADLPLGQLDRPQSGHQRIAAQMVDASSPVFQQGMRMPLQAELSWTFTPDGG